ncbi:MAG: hypothetical protein GY839_14850 [candidate division Zixibacteria bacterium]|nr:hypothetical protein [candidate division Zixibacteria bacterium]
MNDLSEPLPMYGNRYALAGWLAIASALLFFPELGAAFFLDRLSRYIPEIQILAVLLKAVGLAIGVYILYIFRQLLNGRYDFHKANNLILVLIWCNVVFFIIGIAGLFHSLERSAAMITIILFVPFGIITVIYGVALLKLQDDLFGLLKPYAYTNIVAGVGAATIILAPIGLIAALASLVIMGLIFLRAKEDTEFL